MCDEWLQNMDNGNLNCVVFLGVRKAFDSINHEILLQKMHDHFGTELEWFKSYLLRLMARFHHLRKQFVESRRVQSWGRCCFYYI
jgi:hypothetical protein